MSRHSSERVQIVGNRKYRRKNANVEFSTGRDKKMFDSYVMNLEYKDDQNKPSTARPRERGRQGNISRRQKAMQHCGEFKRKKIANKRREIDETEEPLTPLCPAGRCV